MGERGDGGFVTSSGRSRPGIRAGLEAGVARRLVPGALLLLCAAAPVRADLGEIAARGSLRVLVSADEEPFWFSFAEDGEPGFARELLEGFARLHRLRLEVVPIAEWDETIPALLKGRGDLIDGINATEARREQIAFSAEVVPARQLIVTREPRGPVRTPAELRSQRVGVVTGTTWEDAVAQHIPRAALVGFPDLRQALGALRGGEITATVMTIADLLSAQRQDPGLRGGMTLGGSLSTCWGVRKEDTELRSALDDYLVGKARSGAWNRLVVKYFKEDSLEVLGRAN